MIGIDAHVLGTRAGGNESYMRNLLRALVHYGEPEAYLAFVHAGEEARTHADIGPMPTCPIPVRSSYLRVPFVLPRLARQMGIRLLHVQYTAPPFAPCPYVISMHDLVAQRLPGSMPFLDRHRLRAFSGRSLRRAAQVFVLTEAIRDDIVETYGLPPERFNLVQPAVDPVFRRVDDAQRITQARARYRLPEHFVLYIGQIQPRKNLVRLAEAVSRLRDVGLPHHLVIVGRRAWLYREMLDEIARLDLSERIHFTDYVAREDLPVLLSAADAFAYISRYEGFGIPVLEALACGTPTLASTDPALVEVAGGAALHADPLALDDISGKLQQILSDSEVRARLQQAGPQRAGAFTLERMATQAIAGYAKALEPS